MENFEILTNFSTCYLFLCCFSDICPLRIFFAALVTAQKLLIFAFNEITWLGRLFLVIELAFFKTPANNIVNLIWLFEGRNYGRIWWLLLIDLLFERLILHLEVNGFRLLKRKLLFIVGYRVEIFLVLVEPIDIYLFSNWGYAFALFPF